MSEVTMPNILKHLKDHKVVDSLIVRHKIKHSAHSYLTSLGFIEIDTPILGPECAEYASAQFTVEAADGTEYALPQSPQVYKQILVASGIDKYYQIAHCFRQEPPSPNRTDQGIEFMQIDIEMETDSTEELRNIAESLLQCICHDLGFECVVPFPIVDGVECMKKYGTDAPDLRQHPDELAFLWIVDLPLLENKAVFERTKMTSSQVVVRDTTFIPSHHIFALPTMDPLDCSEDEIMDIRTFSFDLVLNGVEICSGDIRITDRGLQESVMDFFSVDKSYYEIYLQVLEHASGNGGMAIGLDRLTMLLAGANHFKYVNAFSHSWWLD